jgi:hypothetical protein
MQFKLRRAYRCSWQDQKGFDKPDFREISPRYRCISNSPHNGKIADVVTRIGNQQEAINPNGSVN